MLHKHLISFTVSEIKIKYFHLIFSEEKNDPLNNFHYPVRVIIDDSFYINTPECL